MQTGEVLRREVFNLLDAAKGGRLKKLKEVNKHEIVEGVTEDYMERRVQTLLSYVKQALSLLQRTSGMDETGRFSGHDKR